MLSSVAGPCACFVSDCCCVASTAELESDAVIIVARACNQYSNQLICICQHLQGNVALHAIFGGLL